jgi:hypothetical protein
MEICSQVNVEPEHQLPKQISPDYYKLQQRAAEAQGC